MYCSARRVISHEASRQPIRSAQGGPPASAVDSGPHDGADTAGGRSQIRTVQSSLALAVQVRAPFVMKLTGLLLDLAEGGAEDGHYVPVPGDAGQGERVPGRDRRLRCRIVRSGGVVRRERLGVADAGN